jgi:hypothetical protein
MAFDHRELPHHLVTFSGQSPDLSVLQGLPVSRLKNSHPIELRTTCLELPPHRLFTYAICYPSTCVGFGCMAAGVPAQLPRPRISPPGHFIPPPRGHHSCTILHRLFTSDPSRGQTQTCIDGPTTRWSNPERAKPFPASPRVILTIPYNQKFPEQPKLYVSLHCLYTQTCAVFAG